MIKAGSQRPQRVVPGPDPALRLPLIQVMKDSAPELNVSSSEAEEDKEEAKPDGEKDPDFNQVRAAAACRCRAFCCGGEPLRAVWGVARRSLAVPFLSFAGAPQPS